MKGRQLAGKLNLRFTIDERGLWNWPFLVDVDVGGIHVISDDAASTSVNEALHSALLRGLQHVPGSFDIDLPDTFLLSSRESLRKGWDDPSSVYDQVWFDLLEGLADFICIGDVDLDECDTIRHDVIWPWRIQVYDREGTLGMLFRDSSCDCCSHEACSPGNEDIGEGRLAYGHDAVHPV